MENMALGVAGSIASCPPETPATACCYMDGTLNMKNEKWSNDHSPLDPQASPVDAQYSKAYVRHLLKANEYLAVPSAACTLAFYLSRTAAWRTFRAISRSGKRRRSAIEPTPLTVCAAFASNASTATSRASFTVVLFMIAVFCVVAVVFDLMENVGRLLARV